MTRCLYYGILVASDATVESSRLLISWSASKRQESACLLCETCGSNYGMFRSGTETLIYSDIYPMETDLLNQWKSEQMVVVVVVVCVCVCV